MQIKRYLSLLFYFLLYAFWGATLFSLLYNGTYALYLRPLFYPFLLFALFFMVLFSLLPVEGKRPFSLNYIVILVPLLFIKFSLSKTLNSQAYQKKLTTLESGISTSYAPKALEVDAKIVKTDLVELLVEKYRDRLPLKVEFLATVAHEMAVVPSGYIVLYRFAITCCAADARPLSLLIPKGELTKNLKADQWVKVMGIAQDKKIGDKNFLVVVPLKVQLEAPPSGGENYLYFTF